MYELDDIQEFAKDLKELFRKHGIYNIQPKSINSFIGFDVVKGFRVDDMIIHGNVNSKKLRETLTSINADFEQF